MKKPQLAFIKIKYLLPVFIAAVAVLIPLRIYQYWYLIDGETGFYNKINWAVYALYALIGVYGLVFILCSFLSAEAVESKPPVGKTKGLGFVSFGFAVCFIIRCIILAPVIFITYYKYYVVRQKPLL